MGLLEDCRVFLSKYTNNAILIGVISYIIIKYINNMDKKEGFEENFSENIKIIQKDKSGEIIFDTTTGYYSLLINGVYVKSAKTLSTLKSNKESFKEKNTMLFFSNPEETKKAAQILYNANLETMYNVKDNSVLLDEIYRSEAVAILIKKGIRPYKEKINGENMNNWKERLNKIYKESFKEADYNPKDEQDLNEVSLRLYAKPFHKLSHAEQNDVYKTIEELNEESFKKESMQGTDNGIYYLRKMIKHLDEVEKYTKDQIINFAMNDTNFVSDKTIKKKELDDYFKNK
jgi:hypothetical protein